MTFVRPVSAVVKLVLPEQPAQYDRVTEQHRNVALVLADAKNRKKGQPIDLGTDTIILTASDGSRWILDVSTAGVLSTSAA